MLKKQLPSLNFKITSISLTSKQFFKISKLPSLIKNKTLTSSSPFLHLHARGYHCRHWCCALPPPLLVHSSPFSFPVKHQPPPQLSTSRITAPMGGAVIAGVRNFFHLSCIIKFGLSGVQI